MGRRADGHAREPGRSSSGRVRPHAGPGEATASDVVIAVRAQSDGQARQALEAAWTALAGTALAGPASADARQKAEPRSLEEAVRLLPDANTALISVAGPYAAIEAHKALSHGLHTLLFSDNVSVADEIGLKRRARDLGLLLMGPGAGTSFLGTGLGFSNAVRSGPVGVVAGAGTGAQEIMTLVHRWVRDLQPDRHRRPRPARRGGRADGRSRAQCATRR